MGNLPRRLAVLVAVAETLRARPVVRMSFAAVADEGERDETFQGDVSLANMAAHVVFLAVEACLLGRGDGAVMVAREAPFLHADMAVGMMQAHGLPMIQVALSHLLMNAVVLGFQAIVHLVAAGMVVLERSFGEGGHAHASQQGGEGQGGKLGGGFHGSSFMAIDRAWNPGTGSAPLTAPQPRR